MDLRSLKISYNRDFVRFIIMLPTFIAIAVLDRLKIGKMGRPYAKTDMLALLPFSGDEQ